MYKFFFLITYTSTYVEGIDVNFYLIGYDDF